jgi:hypothetical protein
MSSHSDEGVFPHAGQVASIAICTVLLVPAILLFASIYLLSSVIDSGPRRGSLAARRSMTDVS